MDNSQTSGFKELVTFMAGDIAKAIAVRDGETKQQQCDRTHSAALMIMGCFPRDIIEVILAGHCVMFHAVLTDSVHKTLRGEFDAERRAARGSLVAMNKAFCSNLDLLRTYQQRPL